MDPLSPGRLAEEKLEMDLAKVHIQLRRRLGVVAGVVAVGLFQTQFDLPAGEGMLVTVQSILKAALPVIVIGVAGTMLVWGAARREIQRLRAAAEGTVLRIPGRERAKKPR